MENLHPQHEVYRSRLPGLRARWFLRSRLSDGSLRFREAPLQLDTLWIDMDREQLVLLWRGLVEVESIRLKEINEMLVMLERLTEKERSIEHYQVELERRLTYDEEADAALDAEMAAVEQAMVDTERDAEQVGVEARAEAS